MADRLDELDQKIARLRDERAALAGRRRARRAKTDTRAKILLGGDLLAQARGTGPEAAAARDVYGRSIIRLRSATKSADTITSWLGDGGGLPDVPTAPRSQVDTSGEAPGTGGADGPPPVADAGDESGPPRT